MRGLAVSHGKLSFDLCQAEAPTLCVLLGAQYFRYEFFSGLATRAYQRRVLVIGREKIKDFLIFDDPIAHPTHSSQINTVGPR